MIIANSSPIIILGKQGKLEFLKKCFGKVIIPKTVYIEIIKGKNSPETISLEDAIKNKWIIVEKVTKNILVTDKIGQGEKEAISLASKYKKILLMDDDSARKYASILNVEVHGTLYVIYLAVVKGIINKEEAKNIVERMIVDGFYISIEIYSKFLDSVCVL